MIAKLAAAVLAAGIAPAAAAQDQPSRRDAGDPNRMVCENIGETGSRLTRRRVCMTAQEWVEQRRLTRQGIERLQVRGLRAGE